MKKIIRILLVAMMLFTFIGCSTSNNQNETTETGTKVESGADQEEKVTFPKKEITLVVQSNPGGLSDQTSRVIATEMEKELGVPVVCVYKPGASGAVGMTYVQASPDDGYTIGHAPIEISMLKSLGYANLEPKDIAFLGKAYQTVATLTVAKDARWNSVDEFITYAKEHPGEVKIGNAGTGSIWHIAAMGLEEAVGTEFNHVPFDGAAPAVAALMGGHIDAVTVAPIEVFSGVQGEKLKVLAVMGDERAEAFPNIPTLKETGIDYTLKHWGGFITNQNVPKEVLSILENALQKAVSSEAFKNFTKERGMEASFLPSNDASNFAQEQFDFFANVIPKINK